MWLHSDLCLVSDNNFNLYRIPKFHPEREWLESVDSEVLRHNVGDDDDD